MFKTPLKIALAATIAMPAILAADLANAGQRNNNRHHNAHNSYNHHNYNRGHRSHYRGYGGYNYRHSYTRHHRYSYYPSFYYGGHYGNHYGHHSNVGTYASLAALGLALGFIIHKSSKNRYQDDGYSQQQNYVPRQPYQGGNSSPQTGAGFDFSQCRDTRDYETTILIDGQEQVAYGTACMIEDGSWVAGPMRIDR